ncbi:MAG: ATP-grasp domain-containing protein [Myxococcota bacterium]
MNVAAMQSGPAPSLSVADLDPVATERLVRFDVVSLIGLAKRPDVRAQEKLLGGLSNATVRAFSQRLQILPGVTYAAREGAEAWVRGDAWLGHAGAGVSAALAHLVDVHPKNVIYFDMTALDIDTKLIYGAEDYAGRGMGISTNTSDIVVLPDRMQQVGIDAIRKSRAKAGLPNPYIMRESEFRKHRPEIEREYGPVEMFMRDTQHVDKKSVAWSKVLNNKLDGVNICQRLGVPVPKTYHNNIAGKIDYTRIPVGTPLILKAEYSAGGSGVKFVNDVDDLKKRVAALEATDRIQVQQWVPGEDISFLFHCGERGATLISSSTQEMEHGVSHVGNAIPGDRSRIQDAYARAMKPFADFAQRVGFRGHLGIDARISDVDGDVDFIECNPRRTAVSTPTVIATQLGFPEFCHRQMVFKDKASLDAVLERVAYTAQKNQGVVITTYIGEPGKKYKSEFVFLDRGKDGTAYRDSVIRWAKQAGYLYEEH